MKLEILVNLDGQNAINMSASLADAPGGIDPLTVQWMLRGMLAEAMLNLRIGKSPLAATAEVVKGAGEAKLPEAKP